MKRSIIAATAFALLTGTAFAASDVTCKPCDGFTRVAASSTEAEPKVEKAEFNYKAFSRDPKKFTGKQVKISGRVLQIVEGDDDEVNLRVATSGSYGDIVLVTYTRLPDESRVLEDDRVTITGNFEGLHSYKSVGAGPVTIPHIEGDEVKQAPVAASRRSRR